MRRVGSPNASVIADTVALNEAVEVDFDATERILEGISTTAVVQTPAPLARMVNMTTSNEQLVEALRPVEDPELHRSIVDLGML